jgi:hypothetical protein
MNGEVTNHRKALLKALYNGAPGLGAEIYLSIPPAYTRLSIEAAFAEWARKAERVQLETIWATLSFDSNRDQELVGARSDVQSRQRQWVWQSSAAEVALNLWDNELAPGTVSLSGQVLPGSSPDTVYRVHLLIEDIGVAITTSDEYGEFQFEGLDRGDYFLALVSNHVELIVGPIPVEGVVEGIIESQ